MSRGREDLERRIERLEEVVAQLQAQLNRMSGIPTASGELAAGDREPSVAGAPARTRPWLQWLGGAALLPRAATLCFILVIAFALRAITDQGLIDTEIGSYLGMGYAGSLIAAGWFFYRRGHYVAPVFSVSGAVLLFSIVVETHERFESLPSAAAYVILALAGAALALTSHFNRVAAPVSWGALGMSLAGVALDFPDPVFPYMVLLLVWANLLGTFATRMQRATWLRWVLLLVTTLVMFVWSVRLGLVLRRLSPDEIPFDMAGILWAIWGFSILFATTAWLGVQGRITPKVSHFDRLVPVLNAVWPLVLARHLVVSGIGDALVLGWAVLVWGGLHLGAARAFSRRPGAAAGITPFAVGGTFLCAAGLATLFGSMLTGWTALSLLAYGSGRMSQVWQRGGLRQASYALQLLACLGLMLTLGGRPMEEPSLVGAVASAAVAACAFWHYLWARSHPPTEEMVFLGRKDLADRNVVPVLLGSLVAGFFTLRVGLYQLLKLTVYEPDLAQSFSAGQSVLINLAALGLMYFAFDRRNKEIRNVAILVTVIGGAKVFIVDLLSLQGVPVVVSLLFFGIAAALESFTLTQWQRAESNQGAGRGRSRGV